MVFLGADRSNSLNSAETAVSTARFIVKQDIGVSWIKMAGHGAWSQGRARQTGRDLPRSAKKFHAGQAEVTGETASFVVGWLTNHIPNIDKRYGPFLNANGVA